MKLPDITVCPFCEGKLRLKMKFEKVEYKCEECKCNLILTNKSAVLAHEIITQEEVDAITEAIKRDTPKPSKFVDKDGIEGVNEVYFY